MNDLLFLQILTFSVKIIKQEKKSKNNFSILL